MQLIVNDDGAKLNIMYNNKELTKPEAAELKEEILKVVYSKLDKFQNIKK